MRLNSTAASSVADGFLTMMSCGAIVFSVYAVMLWFAPKFKIVMTSAVLAIVSIVAKDPLLVLIPT